MFDRVVVVDWSASSRPKLGADSIWIASAEVSCGATMSRNVATRREAMDVVESICQIPGRTLLGVDFSLGYPSGTAAALGLSGVAWVDTWELLSSLVVDRDDNSNNRFEVASTLNRRMGTTDDGAPARNVNGPFWGCPVAQRTPWLASTKPLTSTVDEWRRVEQVLRADGRRPFSAWQLLGAGAVGSQSLLGIAALERLRRRLDRSLAVWPLSTGLVVPSEDVVVCEVWPTLFQVPTSGDRVRDDLQVCTVADALVERIRDARLSEWFAPRMVDAETKRIVVDEEGWVFGA